MMNRSTGLLLNIGHAIDHMFLLIFATAVVPIAAEFGFAEWEDLLPYSVGAFILFGLGSMPSGRLGDLWGRRTMMLIFFFGMGCSALLASAVQGPWQMAFALTLLGAFASIYHPVGIPMLVQHSRKPGLTIGINGLAGNLGIAVAAVLTGLLVKYFGWRAAFVVPGLAVIVCGIIFARVAPAEAEPPARRKATTAVAFDRRTLARLFVIMTFAAISTSLLFNFTTNGNAQLLRERFAGIIDDPAHLGFLLAAVYVVASFTQLVVGKLIDRYPLKALYLAVVACQIPLFWLASHTQGWPFLLLMLAFMAVVFGAIPFSDALIVRYVDDSMRSRVSGMRLAVSFGVSSVAVYMLGPTVKAAGFSTLLMAMAGIAACTLCFVAMLPGASEHKKAVAT